jgi:hypothetical protein
MPGAELLLARKLLSYGTKCKFFGKEEKAETF